MALRKSPRGLIKPYTREGVTSTLKKTAKNAALMRSAAKFLSLAGRQLQQSQISEEAAEDAMVDIELLAMQVGAAAKSSVKDLKHAVVKVEKYLAETFE